MDGTDHRGTEHQELRVLVWSVTGHEQRAQIGVAHREVDVLARPVDTGERLLVEQALHAVFLGDRLEDGHQQLLVIRGDVAALEHRGDLELTRRDLVVAGLGGDAELEQLTLGVHHEAQHSLGHRTEVVVVELLALRRFRAEQGATRIDQVGAGQEEVTVDQEVLLLRPAERDDLLHAVVAEQLQDALGVCAHRLLAAQQWCLVVQCLAGHRHEHRRDTQRVAVRVLQDVGRAGDVPTGVAAGLEGAAQSARREAGCVRFALNQRLTRELGQCLAVGDRFQEAVVLLGGQSRHRIEDVRIVRGALRQRPVLHRRGDRVGDGRVQLGALFDGGDDRFVHRLGQPQPHLGHGEHVRTEDRTGLLARHEADGRRHVRLDVVDRLQTHCISAHWTSYRCGSPALLRTVTGQH